MNETIDPKHAILLVMDYQNGIVDRMPDAQAILERMAATIQEARKAGLAVGYVRVALTDDEYQTVPASNRTFRAAADARSMHADAPETQIHDAVAPEPGDIIVRKNRVGAFSTTDLHKQLQARDIDTLILAGFSTSGVVLSTVRDAADKDYRIFVLEDVTADPNQKAHDTLIHEVFPRQARIIKSSKLPAFLKAA